MVTPARRRAGVQHLVRKGRCSERQACRVLGLARSSARYQPRPRPGEAALVRRLKRLATKHKRYGYRRLTALLRRQGLVVNRKRIHRLWKQEGLQVPWRRRRKRRGATATPVPQQAERPNQVWSYDFVEDRTARGGKIRCLTIVDEFTRECPAIRTERHLPASTVIETLEELFQTRGAPAYLRSDNGSEFIAGALKTWLTQRGCQTLYIEPGHPWENPYIESFNGKFREECLNQEDFATGREAQVLVEAWRQEYNECRPHSALDYQTPTEFRQAWEQQQGQRERV